MLLSAHPHVSPYYLEDQGLTCCSVVLFPACSWSFLLGLGQKDSLNKIQVVSVKAHFYLFFYWLILAMRMFIWKLINIS